MAKTKKRKALPVAILNELKIALALRGYSTMSQKDPMSVREQWTWMQNFYHGKGSTHPSQVDMLVKGVNAYSHLFDQVTPTVVSKNHQGVGYQLVLKSKLLRNITQDWIAGVDILGLDSEK